MTTLCKDSPIVLQLKIRRHQSNWELLNINIYPIQKEYVESVWTLNKER